MAEEYKTDVSIKDPVNTTLKSKEADGKKLLNLNTSSLDFLKWVVGTLILGIVGNIVTCNYNNAQLKINNKRDSVELELKRMDIDSKLMEAVSSKYIGNDTSERRYLEFLTTFITTDSLKKAVNQRMATLNIRTKAKTDSAIKTENTQIQIDANKLNSNIQQEYKKLAKSVPSKPSPMTDFIKNEDTIKQSNKVSIDTFTVSKIEQSKIITTPVVTRDSYILVGTPQTLWCKEGYYVLFNDILHIYIKSLDKTIGISAQIINEKTNALIDDTFFKLGDQKSYELENGYKYMISLDYIGAAGKNPFTKAAYITVVTYKKQ